MICLAFPGHSSFDMVLIIFYTCIWLPCLQLKSNILAVFAAVFGTKDEHRHADFEQDQCEFDMSLVQDGIGSLTSDIPVVKYGELLGGDGGDVGAVDGLCSVCLAEFEAAEEVHRLPACGHVFHGLCIARWLDRDRFSCPLCRSNVFGLESPVCNEGAIGSLD